MALAVLCIAELEVAAADGHFCAGSPYYGGGRTVRVCRGEVETFAIFSVPSTLEVSAATWCGR